MCRQFSWLASCLILCDLVILGISQQSYKGFCVNSMIPLLAFSSLYQLDGLKLTFKKNRKKRKKETGLCGGVLVASLLFFFSFLGVVVPVTECTK